MLSLNERQLQLQVTAQAGVYRLIAAGHLDIRTCRDMRATLTGCATAGVHEIVIDLQRVVRVDAAGLAAVTAPAIQLRRKGLRVQILLPTHPEARRVVDMAGVLSLLQTA